MIENHVNDQFSLALDGELTPGEQREFAAHLTACHRCSRAFSELERSVRSMQRVGIPPLTGAAVEAIVGAAYPELLAAPQGPVPFDRSRGEEPETPKPPRRTGTPWPLILSHAAAVLLGFTLMFGGRAMFSRGGSLPAPLLPERVEVIREVEVFVEVPVEVIVEVPKEVVREVIKEVIREVPVETVVERRVPHPLQRRLDAGYGVAVNVTGIALLGAQGLGGALEAASAREAIRIADLGDMESRRLGAASQAAPSLADSGDLPLGADRARSSGGLVVLRDGERLILKTRGTRAEVVPALIEALDDADPALAAAALEQLMGIRNRMVKSGLDTGTFPSSESRTSASLEEPIDRAGGLRGLLRQSRVDELELGETYGLKHSAAAWRTWWRTASENE